MKTLRWMLGLTVAIGVVVCLAAGAGAQTWHVDGDWTGPSRGTADAPFTTLGEAVEAYVKAGGGTVKVAGGLFKSDKADGNEDFGKTGYDLQQKAGAWRGGYVGHDGERFNWEESDRTPPDAAKIDEKAMTVIDLADANARAFVVGAYSVDVKFDGFVFRNAKVTQKDYHGGALYVGGGMSASSVHNCVFMNNQTTGEGGGLRLSGRGGTSTHCTFIGNRAGVGGGAAINPGNASQTIRNFTFRDNHARTGGGLYVPSHEVVVEQSTFANNTAEARGGAAAALGKIRMDRCRLVGNRAPNGAAVGDEAHRGPVFELTNCLVAENTATDEAGFALYAGGSHGGGHVVLRFCTVANNPAAGGAVRASDRLVARNCIIAGDGQGEGLVALTDKNPDLGHNNVHGFAKGYGGHAKAGEGSMSQPPDFRDPAGGDYRPEMDAPAVNRAADIGIDVDLDGNSRPYNQKDDGIDMGCHEVAPVPRDTVLLLR